MLVVIIHVVAAQGQKHMTITMKDMRTVVHIWTNILSINKRVIL